MAIELVDKKDMINKRRLNDQTKSYRVLRTGRIDPTTKEIAHRKVKNKEII